MNNNYKKIELLSPAGDLEKLTMAVNYGADAVYMSGRLFGMRTNATKFSDEDLRKAVNFAHGRGKQVYVTCNTIPREDELKEMPGYMEFLQDAGVDALIMADMGVFSLAGKYAPRCERHISTQASISN